MNKFISLNRVEKTVFVIGIISIIIIISAGVLKNQFSEHEVYVPKEVKTSEEITLIHDKFIVEKGSKVSTEIINYIDADESTINDVILDISSVNTNVIGSYNATIKSSRQTKKFTITVVQNINPTISISHPSFQFLVTPISTMDEVKAYADVKALDALGNDISSTITGWESGIPLENKIVVYTLKATDQYGHSASTTLNVEYIY